MKLDPIRTDKELFDVFMPSALDHCKVMRPGDMENASVIIGAAVWRTFCYRERRQVGRLFKFAVQQGDLPLQLAPKGKSTSLHYKLKVKLSDLRVPSKRPRLPVPPAPTATLRPQSTTPCEHPLQEG